MRVREFMLLLLCSPFSRMTPFVSVLTLRASVRGCLSLDPVWLVRTVSVLFLSVLAANAATTYSYEISQSVPCTTCSGQIGMFGTVTVDALGSLKQNDFVDWTLSLSLSTGTELPVVMTPASSVFSVVGSLAITSTDTDLYITQNSLSEGFAFLGYAGDTGAQWQWGFQPPANIMAYSDRLYGGKALGELPVTLTASKIGAVAVPEPASRSYGLLVSAAAMLVGAWRKFRSRSQFCA